nr:hypothetical protein [Tanacetum cinerariifolium]
MASAVICLSKGQKFNFSKYIFDSLVRNVDSNSKFYTYPHFIQLIIQNQVGDLSTHTTCFISPALTQKVFANMRRVGKGFSRVETPLFEGMIAERQPAEEELGAEQVQVDAAVVAAVVEAVAEDVVHMATPSPLPHGISSPPQEPSSPLHQPPCLEHDKAAQQLEIVKLKAKVKKSEKINMVKSSKLRRLKKDDGIELVADQEKDAEVKGRHADKQSELYNLDQDHSSKVLSMQEDAIEPKILNIAAAPAVSTRRRKGVLIRDPEEELPSDTPAETLKVKGILIKAPKPMKKKDQIEIDAKYARKLQKEINKEHEETYKNIDWNAALDHVQSKEPQLKMDFFKGMKYDEILPIFQAKFDANMRFLFKSREEIEEEDQEIIKSINETSAQKAAKRRKLSEEAQEAKDLRKRLEIVEDEDDDVFVEATPLAQKSVHGLALVKRWKLLTSCGVHVITLSTVQLFLLVERRYPLLRFTLEQLVNVTRLQVEEESKMSSEQLRVNAASESKDCQSNIDVARLKLKLFKNITAAEDITK